MRLPEAIKHKAASTRDLAKRHPYATLMAFVVIVVAVAGLGYLRYQQVEAELAAQQDIRWRVQKGFDNWSADFAMRFGNLKESVLGTARGAGNLVGGVWGVFAFVTTAILDYIGNLHIMIPVTVIYLGVGFFGALRFRVATLLGALLALWLATRIGIVPASVLGLLAVAGLLGWDKLDPRFLTAVQGLPQRVVSRVQGMRSSGGVNQVQDGGAG